MKRLLATASAVSGIVLIPGAAGAHIVGARLGDFYAGALHPMTDPIDVVLWVATGVLAGSLGARKASLLVLLFPLGLLAGLALGAATGVDHVSSVADAGLLCLIGLLLAAARPLPAWLLGAIAFAIAGTRGLVNAGGTQPQTDTLLFAAGLVTAGYAVVTIAMAVTVVFCRPAAGWRPIAIRAIGSWIAAVGLMMGGFAFTG
jgi:hypothetical protein